MKKFILSILLILTNISVQATDTTAPLSSTENAQVTLILPVNWTSTDQYNFVATIPKGFRSLQALSEWGKKEATLIEFIPVNEDANEWSEIITLNKFIGKQFSAKEFVSLLKKQLLASVENGKVLQESSSKETGYETASLALSYDLNGKHEILNLTYFSGPDDIAGIQYTIRPNETESDTDALNKIEAFFKDQTHIVKSNPNDD